MGGVAHKGLGILCSYRFTDKRAVMKGSENAEVEDGDGCRDCESMRSCAPVHVSPPDRYDLYPKHETLLGERMSPLMSCGRMCMDEWAFWTRGCTKDFHSDWYRMKHFSSLIFISCVCLFKKKKKKVRRLKSWHHQNCLIFIILNDFITNYLHFNTSTLYLKSWILFVMPWKKITLLECPVLVQTSNYKHLNCLFPHTKFSRFLS